MKALPLLALALFAATTAAAPVTYDIDPMHTYPSFEADHMGMSMWRGKLTKNTGTIVYDKASGSGTVDVQMDLAAIDFGLEAMNAWARGKSFFNLEAGSPPAVFKGRFDGAAGGPPSRVVGELTLNGKHPAPDAGHPPAQVRAPPAAQARLVRRRRLRQLQPRGLRPGGGQGLGLQDGRRPAHPGRSCREAMSPSPSLHRRCRRGRAGRSLPQATLASATA